MAKLVHFHPFLGTATGCCTNTAHHADCSRFGLSPANEVSCVYRRGVSAPKGRPVKCTHEEPDIEYKVPAEQELLLVSKRAVFKTTTERRPPAGKGKKR